MWYNENSSSVVRAPRAITVGGIQHPPAIFRKWSKEKLEEIGIYSVEVARVDSRYYKSGKEVYTKKDRRKPDGTYAGGADYYEVSYETTEKDPEGLKESIKESVRSQIGSLLSPSDWRVIRAQETGDTLRADWAQYRSDVRAFGNALEVEVDALVTLADVIAFQNSPVQEDRYVSTYDEEGVEVIGPDYETVDRVVNKAQYGWPTAPDAEVDPYAVV